MAHTATITTRIDPKLKNKATKIVEGLGLDLSSVLRAFIHQITLQNRIPLDLRYHADDDGDPGYNPAFVRMVLEADGEAKDSDLKAYPSVDEAFDDILGKDWRNAQSQV